VARDGPPGESSKQIDETAQTTANRAYVRHRQLQSAPKLRVGRKRSFRRFLHDLAGRLTAVAASAFWIGEYGTVNQAADAPEFASGRRHHRPPRETGQPSARVRVLQVAQASRKAPSARAEHAYRIGSRWDSTSFPRLADDIETASYTLDSQRALHRKFPRSTKTLGDGLLARSGHPSSPAPTGAGKNAHGIAFLVSTEPTTASPGVLANVFRRNTTQTRSHRERIRFGTSPTPDVHVLGRSPVDLHVDEWAYEPSSRASKRTGARRVVVGQSWATLLFRVAGRDSLSRTVCTRCRKRLARPWSKPHDDATRVWNSFASPSCRKFRDCRTSRDKRPLSSNTYEPNRK